MEDKVINIASELFGVEVTKDTKIGDIESWDSLGQINLFMAIESELGIKVSPDEIIENDSIIKIVELLKNRIG